MRFYSQGGAWEPWVERDSRLEMASTPGTPRPSCCEESSYSMWREGHVQPKAILSRSGLCPGDRTS